MIGKTLGHYQITGQLGKGGMGEVFRAKDQKLGRDVAIKMLPAEFAKDADRVARFRREAKLLASLNHPNIATIYGLEESGETSFLVLELIEGETLSDRIRKSPVPIEESLKLALQITEAFEAAHDKGVIHRDLKPANIKVTPEGKVKVLDFGLAKAYAGEQADLNLSNSPTLSNAATQQGVILGTAAYMSPEQARGKPVDRKADIWAFGCVLFEMLAGRATFSGKDVTDILAAVIRAEPEWNTLPANLHWRLREVLERCLQKEAGDRYHDISDVKADLQRILTDPSGVFARPGLPAEPRARVRIMLPWVAAALAMGAIIAGVAIWKLKPPEPRPVIRFDYELPEGQQFSGDWPIDISPDGKKVVYCTPKGLYLRSMDELTTKLMPGTDGASDPFFSRDGKWIGYLSLNDLRLKKISIYGGAPVTLRDMTQMAGASWGADDTIVFSSFPNEILRIPAGGGTSETLVKSPDYLIYPQILPGGKALLYTTYKANLTQPRIMVRLLQSGESRELLPGLSGRYIPTGHIIYGSPDGNVHAVKFDLDRLEIAGKPFPIGEGMGWTAISDSGTLVYTPIQSLSAAPRVTLVWVNREGKEESLGTPVNSYSQPAISPDGTRIALSIGPGMNKDIWIWDIARKTLTKLTFDKTREITPIWSPNGKQIAYWADTSGVSPNGVFRKAADGTGEAEKIISAPDPRQLHLFSWSGDGKALLMQEMVTWTNMDICTLAMEGDHIKKPLLQTESSEAQPKLSPDGRWIAYSSNENTGAPLKTEVYVRPFPEVNKGKWQVSTAGGNCPLWSPDGRELFYLSADGHAMSVTVETGPAPRFGTPKVLFKNTNLGLTVTSGYPWDIHPDGKRFLMIEPPPADSSGEKPRPKIIVVTNWFEELKQRAPAK